MSDIDTEQMQRSAQTFDNAADQLQRTVGQFTESVYMLNQLLGQGYGSNIDRLIEALESHAAALKGL